MEYYLFLAVTLAITIGSQLYLKTTYKINSKINSKKGITGADVARRILDHNGLENVKIEKTYGFLSDHYDPRTKVVRLSDSIYGETSIAAVSVAAHECGHAIQDKEGYVFLRIRSMIVPIVNLASTAGYIAILIGFFAGIIHLILLGIICEVAILIFQLITLPVEFNASRRGLKQIKELELIESNEKGRCKRMLTAAALTYVASVATSAIQILRLILMMRRRDWFNA